jgi:hypothetical protein
VEDLAECLLAAPNMWLLLTPGVEYATADISPSANS